MIKKCTCADYIGKAATFQNKRYGEGYRVQNKSKGPNGAAMKTCTVCGKKTS